MQNQNPQDDIPSASATNMPPTPTPGMSLPAQYPYPPQQYQQPYPQYAPMASSTSSGVIKSALIGGGIACGIDLFVALLITLVPAVNGMATTIYETMPLLPFGNLTVGNLVISLIIVLLCSPGFFVAGSQAARQTEKISPAIMAGLLALAGFAVVDFGIITILGYYTLFILHPTPSLTAPLFWEIVLPAWIIDSIVACPISLVATMLGIAIGKQKRQ